MRIPPPSWQDNNQAALFAALGRIHALLRRAAGDVAEPPAEAECPPALETLCTLFHLSPFERDVLLLCAGAELESRFVDAYAAAQGDRQAGYPTFALALAVLPGAHWSALAPSEPLRRWRLITTVQRSTVASSPLRIDERILHFLTGMVCHDERLTGMVHRTPPATPLPTWMVDTARTVAQALRSGERVALAGRMAADRALTANAALDLAGLQPWQLRIADIPIGPGEREILALYWNREARLSAGGLLLRTDGTESPELIRLAAAFLTRIDTPLVLDVGEAGIPEGVAAMRITLPEPDVAARRDAWVAHLGSTATQLDGSLDAIARQFRLDTPTMTAAVAALGQHAASHPGEDLRPVAWRICREHARRSMEQSAARVEPKADWDSLVLPEAQLRVLRQIALQLRHRTTVLEKWGFADKYSRGLAGC